VGKIEIEATLIPLHGDDASLGDGEGIPEDDEDLLEKDGPRSVLEGIDWNELGRRIGGTARGLGRYEFASFLSNEVGSLQVSQGNRQLVAVVMIRI